MHEIIESALNANRSVLTITESKKIFDSYGLPINKSIFVENEDDLVQNIGELRPPVVMKIVSPQITHKTDVGGVVLDLQTPLEIKKAYIIMTNVISKLRPDASIQGVIIEEQVKNGLELILGTFNDPVFGSILMFGLGGIFVEVLKDVAFRLIPIDEQEAYDIIDDIKSSFLLKGYRGKNSINREQLVSIILSLSKIVEDNPIKEIDINPLISIDNKLVVVDARIILKEN
ncbi:MAG: hypothetical protein HeimC3_28670 [Candidatus Heimdallarchaeota archaeon LC_3]|nr:MAG: hypothetical protein HeimC3_28670 [Candidatus Heimdallarchaeota archaeon LC_3]